MRSFAGFMVFVLRTHSILKIKTLKTNQAHSDADLSFLITAVLIHLSVSLADIVCPYAHFSLL